MMSPGDVVEVMEQLAAAGVAVWLDGGWGIDALVGEQTREHDDLDVVLALGDAQRAHAVLAGLGFVVAVDALPTRLVLRDGADRRVDCHTVTFDAAGNGLQLLQDGTAWVYPGAGFTGIGRVAGRAMRCLTPDVQALTHRGYVWDEDDRRDMALLRDRFGVVLPEPSTS